MVQIPVSRTDGADGRVELAWEAKNMTAVYGKDYDKNKGILVFEHGQRKEHQSQVHGVTHAAVGATGDQPVGLEAGRSPSLPKRASTESCSPTWRRSTCSSSPSFFSSRSSRSGKRPSLGSKYSLRLTAICCVTCLRWSSR